MACKQVVTRLGGALPVMIGAGPEWEETGEALDDLFLGDAELWCAPALVRPQPLPQPACRLMSLCVKTLPACVLLQLLLSRIGHLGPQSCGTCPAGVVTNSCGVHGMGFGHSGPGGPHLGASMTPNWQPLPRDISIPREAPGCSCCKHTISAGPFMPGSAGVESGMWHRRRAARGEPEDPRGGRQPYVSAEGHTILDLYFGAPRVTVNPVVCMLQCALLLCRINYRPEAGRGRLLMIQSDSVHVDTVSYGHAVLPLSIIRSMHLQSTNADACTPTHA